MKIYPKILETLKSPVDLSEARKKDLEVLINYISTKLPSGEVILNFICTHNSRRSQMAQLWAQAAAAYFDLPVRCLSGGVEVTAFNPRAVQAIRRAGFRIEQTSEGANPKYHAGFSDTAEPLVMFSKLYDDPVNRAKAFAAVMVCSHADANCPFIPGTEKRISLTYDDPKEFDGTDLETARYDERSQQIAREMFYVFNRVKNTENE